MATAKASPMPLAAGDNVLSFNQASTLLNQIVNQATGQSTAAPLTMDGFISVAQTGLACGYDPMLNAISQVLSRTIFSTRPYTRKFAGMQADSIRYGNHVRKINYIDTPWQNDDRFSACGASVDQMEKMCPPVLQTNFYGGNTYQRGVTILKDQLDTAFRGPEEFGRFISGLMTNVSNQIEQVHEEEARASLANYIAGKITVGDSNVVHLITEYNAHSGKAITAATVYAPENFPDFARFAYARIKNICKMMTERSLIFHQNVEGKPIMRHTPYRYQKIYLYDLFFQFVDTQVKTQELDNRFMELADHESVTYWQSILSPQSINTTPVYMGPNGEKVVAENPVNQDNVIGVIFDRETIGYTVINQWSAPTPFDARGGYSNIWYHFTDRNWVDYTENGVVLVLD